MNSVAGWAAEDRAALFGETANRRGVSPMVIEKDFWVCWTLEKLFRSDISHHLIFKGGTSLSKVYGLIERFSEDIDLSLSRSYLGFTGEHDPEEAPSKNKRRKLVHALQEACRERIGGILLPGLRTMFASELSGASPAAAWSLSIDDQDPQTLVFRYPAAPRDASGHALPYLSPTVRLELGARSDDWPASWAQVASYAADAFPHLFSAPGCSVKVLAPERTFWEKATLLHAEHHRPAGSRAGDRLSRHYYDLFMLAHSPFGEAAMNDLDLLMRVALHKSIFFECAWARYEEARPGSIHLLPSGEQVGHLRRDYQGMAEMFFGESPPFDEILAGLEQVEKRINSSG